jgi:membrane protein
MTALTRRIAVLAERLGRDDILTLASSIAYAALLSIFPLLIGLVVLLSRVASEAEAQRVVLTALSPYLPSAALELVRQTLEDVFATREAAGLLALVALFWSGTAVAGALRHGLNQVLHVRVVRPFWRRKLIDLALIALGGIALSLSLITSTMLTALSRVRAIGRFAELIFRNPSAPVIAVAGPVVFMGVALVVIYHFLPNRRLRWRSVIAAALTGLVLVEATTRSFLWYLNTLADYPLVYGPLAGLVVFLLWVYLIALDVLLGGKVAGFVEEVLDRADAERSAGTQH